MTISDFKEKVKSKLKRIDPVDGQCYKIEKKVSDSSTEITYTQKVEAGKQYKMVVFKILNLEGNDDDLRIKIETKLGSGTTTSVESSGEFDAKAIKNDPIEHLEDMLSIFDDMSEWSKGVKARSAAIGNALSILNFG